MTELNRCERSPVRAAVLQIEVELGLAVATKFHFDLADVGCAFEAVDHVRPEALEDGNLFGMPILVNPGGCQGFEVVPLDRERGNAAVFLELDSPLLRIPVFILLGRTRVFLPVLRAAPIQTNAVDGPVLWISPVVSSKDRLELGLEDVPVSTTLIEACFVRPLVVVGGFATLGSVEVEATAVPVGTTARPAAFSRLRRSNMVRFSVIG